jgi:hypothetical protein
LFHAQWLIKHPDKLQLNIKSKINIIFRFNDGGVNKIQTSPWQDVPELKTVNLAKSGEKYYVEL